MIRKRRIPRITYGWYEEEELTAQKKFSVQRKINSRVTMMDGGTWS